jgi:hypothetical protein
VENMTTTKTESAHSSGMRVSVHGLTYEAFMKLARKYRKKVVTSKDSKTVWFDINPEYTQLEITYFSEAPEAEQ